ncbi:MAG: cytochrome c biogenesis protein CcdA [Ferruginibacter sp.]
MSFISTFFSRLVIVFILVTVGTNALAQDSIAIPWKVISEKISPQKYLLKISGEVKPGWFIYANDDKADELEGIKILLDSSVQSSPLRLTSSLQNIHDKIFDKDRQVASGMVLLEKEITFSGEVPADLPFTLVYAVADAENFLPKEIPLTVKIEGGKSAGASNRILISTINLEKPVNDCGKLASQSLQAEKSSGLLSLFILGFLGGLVALLTPCVFPMIPLTVSFFTKKAQSRKTGVRNAFLYGFFIFLIYILLSVPFHFLDKLDPAILNNISTNVILNVVFFVVFVVFAISFFGYFEISLPGSITNSADSKSGLGKISGIFFMALTLAIVSFSCTGPILGSLLAGSLTTDGGAMQLTSGMAGFGLALALPFALFALFPNWLNSLPKSGGWLTTVKVVLGFIELAMAFKFLSNADLVSHWGLLKREVFIGIWILIGLGLSLYLFGIIHFPHDDPNHKISKNRKLVGLITLLFTLYLVPGLTNSRYANLTLISGFPPPLYYSIYHTGNECVLNLTCTHDYDEGLALARSTGKPLLLDFTGYACVNCRRMEENIWSDPTVYEVMKNNYVVVSLYVDDKKKLPLGSSFTYEGSDGSTRQIKTVGDKWSAFETENFKNNAQPLYAILNNKEELMNYPVGYTPSAAEYLDWLKCGLEAFDKTNK